MPAKNSLASQPFRLTQKNSANNAVKPKSHLGNQGNPNRKARVNRDQSENRNNQGISSEKLPTWIRSHSEPYPMNGIISFVDAIITNGR
ncbi:hypothetical protein TNIN_223131 [Trichonephila inaurata madagascariensis]|uniref:Uncharacterized protein n=1 Tax=Trichonephila inaurata madagascariensis TaxID=2747483 RepID=A0A8X6X0Y3_9ARAC|nr:hypothetical protein TNIN_223131 [Trichonephila inaurata madagascariensis]